MKLLCFGASHQDLDLAELERLSSGASSVVAAVRARCVEVVGTVVLATCNRFEIYVEFLESDGLSIPDDAVTRVEHVTRTQLTRVSGLSPARIRNALRVRRDDDAIAHLFAVSSGLESMIVGEREIAGQVRRALEAARSCGNTSPALEQVFQRASRVSRRIETTTGLGASGRSIVGVGLDLIANTTTTNWATVRTLVIGTGSYAGATLAALRARGAHHINVFSPSGRAHNFATTRGATPICDAHLDAALAEADVLIACSGNLGGFVDAAMVRGARRRNGAGAAGRPLAVLDLALRRDVAADVAELPGVRMFDLVTIQQHAPSVAVEPVVQAWELIQRATTEFRADMHEREHRARQYAKKRVLRR